VTADEIAGAVSRGCSVSSIPSCRSNGKPKAMKSLSRPVKHGEGRPFLARLPLVWQWLLVFVLSVYVLVSLI
jgi:hypothetical protein